MPRLTRSQLVVAILVIIFVAVIPGTIAVWQGFSSEPMVPAVARWLNARGWDVTIPEWAPFVIPPVIGAAMFIILLVQLRQQHIAVKAEGGQVPEDRPEQDRPPPIQIGTNYGQFTGVNRGIMNQTINVGPKARTLRGLDLARARQRLTRYQGTDVFIASVMGDTEGTAFANEIRDLLLSTGWLVPDPVAGGIMAGPAPTGLIVKFQGLEGDEPHPAMMELGTILLNLGFEAVAEGVPSLVKPQVFVGTRGTP